MISARAEKQTEAHRLIEQLMVLNNEQVAAVLEARRTPTLYRVHEQPDPDRIARLFDQLASLDLPAPPLFDGFGPVPGRADGGRGVPARSPAKPSAAATARCPTRR